MIFIHCNFPVPMKMLENEYVRSEIQTSSDGRCNFKGNKVNKCNLLFLHLTRILLKLH